MLSFGRAWRRRWLTRCPKRELSLAYDLHKPHELALDHAPLIVLHGLFGSKRNNRSISKYGCSRPSLRLYHLKPLGPLRETSKRQCMLLSVLCTAAKEIYFAYNAPGSEKSWRFTALSSARLFSDGRRRGRIHLAASIVLAYNYRTFNVSFHLLHKDFDNN